ncbi:C-type lectin domain-containing protein [Hyalangium minutum]|uniref:Trypsin domain protein n=1 Tax=Hyalangium minutum TaxID=394096 RepID=A0A085W9M2_9BACT|nr:C-type lectin domain-containing protein [Hyalangium minutum]KFE64385.1 trypsin domain protein [Hyalangium minutum]
MPLFSLIKKPFSLLCTLALTVSPLVGCGGAPLEAGFEEEVKLGTTEQAISYNGGDYLFVTTPKTWNEARSACLIQGYDLVTIDDSAEEAFLQTQEAARNMRNVWIGYTDQGFEGLWAWANGVSTYTHWYPGQPDDYLQQEDCAVDRYTNPSQNIQSEEWNDFRCDETFSFICERRPEPTANRGSFSYSTSNTSSATANTYNYVINLYAGQLFTLGTCGVPGSTGTGDTYLRLFNPSGQEIASNDDSQGACGILSNFSVIVPVTGTYVVRAGCYGTGLCSGTVAFNY